MLQDSPFDEEMWEADTKLQTHNGERSGNDTRGMLYCPPTADESGTIASSRLTII